mgnify:CR=1 FL=1
MISSFVKKSKYDNPYNSEKTISDTLRREGIITSAMAQSEKQTGVNQTIISPNGSKTSFSNLMRER